MLLAVLLLVIGFAILIKGADFLVDGASSIAKKFGISSIAIGLTVVSFGTSAPELVVNMISAFSGKPDAAFGNVIGSNNFNLLLILGVAGVIYPLVVQRNTVKYEVPFSLFAVLVLYILVNDGRLWGSEGNMLSRTDAFILLVFFGLFMTYIYHTMKNGADMEERDAIKTYPPLVATGLSILGMAMLVGGGKLAVDNAIQIAKYFNLSDKLIGLTILAAGTSLPELATSAVAAWRKNTDIAIGNVVGSNIFNIFFILGITGSIHPLPFQEVLNFDIYVLTGATLLLLIFMFTLNQSKLDRWEALLLLMLYITYMVYMIGVEFGMA
jgi:cation:H+ antiporter